MTDRAELAKRLLERANRESGDEGSGVYTQEDEDLDRQAATALSAEGGARDVSAAAQIIPAELVNELERLAPELRAIGSETGARTMRAAAGALRKAYDVIAATPQAPGDMAYFAASEQAAYKFPGTDQGELRDAYCQGAADAVSRVQAPGEEGLRDILAEEVVKSEDNAEMGTLIRGGVDMPILSSAALSALRRLSSPDLVAAAKAARGEIEYYIENPSAWQNEFDQTISSAMKRAHDILTAALHSAGGE